MQIKSIFAAIIPFLFSFITTAQTHNPYKDIGKKGKVLTLTNGEYDEFFDEDSIQRIGSALVNINTMKVVRMNLTKEEKRQLNNAKSSRFLSVDPLTSGFPMLTPYQYAANSPIAGIDLDGEEFKYYALKDVETPVITRTRNGTILTFQKTALEATHKIKVQDEVIVAGKVTYNVEIGGIPLPNQEMSFRFSLVDLGIQANLVTVKGIERILPKQIDLENLPTEDDDEFWASLETKGDYLNRLRGNAAEYLNSIKGAALPFMSFGMGALKERAASSALKPQIHHFVPWQSKKFTKQLEK